MWSFLAEDVPGNQPELELEPSPPEGCHRPGTTSQCQSSANLVRSLKHYSIFFRSPTALRFPFRSFISFFLTFFVLLPFIFFFLSFLSHCFPPPNPCVCFFTSLNIYDPIVDYILLFFCKCIFHSFNLKISQVSILFRSDFYLFAECGNVCTLSFFIAISTPPPSLLSINSFNSRLNSYLASTDQLALVSLEEGSF